MKPRCLWGKILSLVLILFVLTVQAATGPEVAQLLNTRYRSTPQECPGSHAAYFCSGVLVSDLASGLPIKFWEHTDSAIALGARSFSYLRSDQGIRSLTQNSGMVFSDPFTAISQGKSVDVLCAYPLVASIQGNYGCGTGGSQEDPASCAALGVSDASGWLAHFQQQGQQPSLQCSLSSLIPAQFRASLLAHEQLGDSWVTQPNQVQVRNWNAQAPAQVPVQALFYDTAHTGGLRLAQRNQRDYHAATGQWLPILRLDLAGGEGVFGFNLQDQLYVGYEVAIRLNARYFDTAMTCPDGRASFYCNGVVLRGTESTTDFQSWNPSPRSELIKGVSASYVRVDTMMSLPAWPQGLLFKELAAPTANPLTVRCLYPFDGLTGGLSEACTGRTECAALGVDSVESWLHWYSTTPYDSCSFAPSAHMVQVLIDIRNTFPHPPFQWNEVILTPWEQRIPERLPVDALFYDGVAYNPGDGRDGARYIQDDYFKTTGRFWPIVHLRLEATDGQIFTFTPNDQCLDDSCPAPIQALSSQATKSWFEVHGQ